MMRRVILGMSGASGAAIGLQVGRLLAAIDNVELHLVVTSAARRTIAHEAGNEAMGRLIGLATHFHSESDIGASIASGSFRTAGMIVALVRCGLLPPSRLGSPITSSPGGRCAAQGASQAGSACPRNAAASRALAQYGRGDRDGGRGDAAGPLFLPQSSERGGSRRPYCGSCRGSARVDGCTLDTGVERVRALMAPSYPFRAINGM